MEGRQQRLFDRIWVYALRGTGITSADTVS